jgi:hypothetical protein
MGAMDQDQQRWDDLLAAAKAMADADVNSYDEANWWHRCSVCGEPLVINDSDHKEDCAWVLLRAAVHRAESRP